METKVDTNLLLERQHSDRLKTNSRLSARLISRGISASETIRRSLLYGRYDDFIYQTLKELTTKHYQHWGFDYHTYYEFGTGTGRTLRQYLIGLKKLCAFRKTSIEDFNVVLFDSFQGLPDQEQIQKDVNPAWSKGLFMGSRKYIESAIDKTLPGKKPKITFVEGFYDNSLSEGLRKELEINPPGIINVDVDLYSSTKIVLNWLQPILQNGTVFHFDDVFEYLGNPYMGELAAISDFNISFKGGAIVPFRNFGVRGFEGKIYTYAKKPY